MFALFGADAAAEPYLSKATNLRRRLTRFLSPQPGQSRRLQLAGMVVRIEYSTTGSDFESQIVLHGAAVEAFGERALKRLKLRTPAFLKMASKNPYPRVYVTNKVTRAAEDSLFGPFPSKVAAERFCDEALNLFLLRRCVEELNPDPAFPGCAYSDMKMCLAPCFKGCSDERYAEEAAAVRNFLATRGESLVKALEDDRDRASNDLEFEKAAQIHARMLKVEAVSSLAAEIVRPLSELDAVILQPSADPMSVAVFLVTKGVLSGPALYSTVGMRHPNEHSGSSSLFAHPTAIEPVVLESNAGEAAGPVAQTVTVSRDVLEQRLDEVFHSLQGGASRTNAATLGAHLCLLTRWYYRPSAKRTGEIFFTEADGSFPAKLILRGVSRVWRSGKAATAPPTESPGSPGARPSAGTLETAGNGETRSG